MGGYASHAQSEKSADEIAGKWNDWAGCLENYECKVEKQENPSSTSMRCVALVWPRRPRPVFSLARGRVACVKGQGPCSLTEGERVC